MKKLLIIGATGLVGSKLVSLAGKHGFEPFSTHNARIPPDPRSQRLDITDRDATTRLVESVQPDVIVHTAALHNVDYCETHRDEATRVNVDGTRYLVGAASRARSRLLYLSTDYVFDGRKGHYNENDTPNPLHHYARTKLEAERIVSEMPSYAIARPSVIYGWNPLESAEVPSSSGKTINFAMYVLDKFEKKETVKAVDDQFSSPTFADNLAEALLRLADLQGNGVFHTAGRSCLSRYEFALEIARVFAYPRSLVQHVSSREFKQVAERPRNSCLAVEMAEQRLGLRFMTVEEGVEEMKYQAASGVARPAVPTG